METLKRVEQLKAELDSLRPLDAEAEARIMQKLRLDWNYHSNKLEGNSYSFGETKMLLFKGLTAGGKPVRDHEEITGHNEAISVVIDFIKLDEPLTEIFIRQLHKLILVRPFWTDTKTSGGQPTKKLVKVGEYKTEPNHIETQSGEIFYFAEPIETPAKMQELVEWFSSKAASVETNTILLAAEFHYRFVRIHPFDDGNGRIARLLMNYILMKYGFPPVIIKNEDKDNYIAVLEQADFRILDPFIEYIAVNLIGSLEIMIRGAKGEDIEDSDDLDKELSLLKHEIKHVGKRIDVSKSKESLLNVFENSIEPLTDKFIEVCGKFDDFYIKSSFLLFWGGGASSVPKEQAIANAKSMIIDGHGIYDATLQYDFINFRQTGFGNFDFSSRIYIKFNLSGYIVSLGEEEFDFYEKLYSEPLEKGEIEKIIKTISNLHKEFIKNSIEDKKSARKALDAMSEWFKPNSS